jgi:hypothetical protein
MKCVQAAIRSALAVMIAALDALGVAK